MPFLACLMLVLTNWSGMAHAAEASGGRIADIQFTVHLAGDGDEVPADGDNGLPHHHSICHGHDIGAPTSFLAPLLYVRELDVRCRRAPPTLVPADQSLLLRPPQA